MWRQANNGRHGLILAARESKDITMRPFGKGHCQGPAVRDNDKSKHSLPLWIRGLLTTEVVSKDWAKYPLQTGEDRIAPRHESYKLILFDHYNP